MSTPQGPEEVRRRRREMFESIGRKLSAELEVAALGKTDRGMQGGGAEGGFREWLASLLPNRFAVISGAIVSAGTDPTTQRDCIIWDAFDCAPFRRIGGLPDLLPVEGVVGAVEINTGATGATAEKIKHDAAKLTEVGRVSREFRLPALPIPERIHPAPHLGGSIPVPWWVMRQTFDIPPLLLIFAESIRGNLADYAANLASHNASTTLGASVDGLFVLDQGFALHLDTNGWAHHRIPGAPLATMDAQPWEVLLKLVTVVWSHLWKGPYRIPDLSPYYADEKYFGEFERPRIKIVSDEAYVAQSEPGFVLAQPKP